MRDARTDAQREHAKSDIEGLTGMFVPVSQTVLALPNHPLDPAKMPMEIDLGGVTVVIETYIGHTDTDLIFRVPQQNVVYTGDLLTGGQYPVNINGYPTKWRATLAKFATFDKNTIFVPGHGQLMGLEGVAEMRSCFDDLGETRKNPTRRASRWKKPWSNTSSPTGTKTIACFPGVSRSAAPTNSFMPSGPASPYKC